MEIAWEKINNGFRGFEKLSLTFVKKDFPNPTWERTHETHDGNTDAVAYVFGYRSIGNQPDQWWMEAKYSTERSFVTRYRLDATIVSAILSGNVKKVVFITNIAIRAKTIIDIRNALTKATPCHDIQFITKPVLEAWLCKNPSIYQDFFPPLALGETLEQSEPLYLTQEIEFYQQSFNSVTFTEPCKILYGNECYVGHFSVYCAENRTVTLRKNRRCRGITIKGKHVFELHSGDNPIRFEIRISPDIQMDENLFYFFLDGVEVFPADFIRLSPQTSIYRELPSQMEVVNHIRPALKRFLKKNCCEYYTISAPIGNGKTKILELLMSDPALTNEYIFYRSFSFSDIDNSLLLVDFILFLLFPYLAPNEIDTEYLNHLENEHAISQIRTLIQLRHSYNDCVDFLLQKCTPEDFLPHCMRVNARIIYLDNVHRMSESLFLFFKKILVELQYRNIPVYIVLTVDESIIYQDYWKELCSYCNITVHHLQLSLEDIMTVMGGSPQVKDTTKDLLQSGNLTATELFVFAQYVSSEAKIIETTEQLLAALRLFQYSDVFGKDIKARFVKIFRQYPECRALCDMVFFSYAPVQAPNVPQQELMVLLENNLLKYDLYNHLIPRSEAVRECYCANFTISLPWDDISIFKEDRLRLILENEQSPSVLRQAAREIIVLANAKQYNSVTYIGRRQFEQDACRQALEGRTKDRALFLQMYFSYAYASQMQSNVQNPQAHFERIISRCKGSMDKRLITLHLRAQWELANSNFENLFYHDVLEDVQAGITILKNMQKIGAFTGEIDTQLKYYDFMAIKSFAESELGKERTDDLQNQEANACIEHGYSDRYYNTKIRLALIKIVVNTHDSRNALKEGTKYFEKRYNKNHKMYLFGMFSILYYDIVLGSRHDLIEPLIKVHEKMKLQQHNNYRKRNFAIATYFYWMGDIETGGRYLFSEIFTNRNLAKRPLGFYYETMALMKLRTGEPQQAIQALQKAQEMFSTVESYARIPQHNISVLKSTPVENVLVEYWQGDSFMPSTYYIDLRITW